MKIVVIAIILTACRYNVAPPPAAQQATTLDFCGTQCWNDSYCTGQGACEICVGGTCTGRQPGVDTTRATSL